MARNKLPRFKAFTKNTVGDFYVMDGCCTCCGAPHAEAPSLIQMSADDIDFDVNNSDTWSCYFKKQPSGEAEVKLAIDACEVSCMQAVRYGGSDPTIIQEFIRRGLPHLCDALLPSDEEIDRLRRITLEKGESAFGFKFLFDNK